MLGHQYVVQLLRDFVAASSKYRQSALWTVTRNQVWSSLKTMCKSTQTNLRPTVHEPGANVLADVLQAAVVMPS